MVKNKKSLYVNQPFDFPGLKPGVCSGLILSGASFPAQKDRVWAPSKYNNLLKNRDPPSKVYLFLVFCTFLKHLKQKEINYA